MRLQTPILCERVHVKGYPPPYFVIAVDLQRQEVDVLPVFGMGPGLDAVPFSQLRRSLVAIAEASEAPEHPQKTGERPRAS
jgi:hypothetical protein